MRLLPTEATTGITARNARMCDDVVEAERGNGAQAQVQPSCRGPASEMPAPDPSGDQVRVEGTWVGSEVRGIRRPLPKGEREKAAPCVSSTPATWHHF